MFLFVCLFVLYCFLEYEVAFDKIAVNGVVNYKDLKEFFKSVGHFPSQKEIDEAIELITKCRLCLLC